MSLRTNEQNAQFHKLLTENRYDADMKEGLVLEVSGGRVTSSKDLSVIEMAKAINHLQSSAEAVYQASRKKMMAKAINLARELNMVRGEGKDIDYDGLNALAKRMYKVERFYELGNEQIKNTITGLENLKRHRKDGKTKVESDG
jgi:hypothetical protein